ncbi:Isoflavipucine cluster transcription factor [Paramyrothecium foliicola]|nr:Isoflavipucine cluster transcription factor [Paramyrothecium foliicola]
MIHVNPNKAQNRRACDRCHQSKLKCVVDGVQKCRRCIRNDTECIFSPATRSRRQTQPRKVLPAQFDSTSPPTNGPSDVDFDWALLSENTTLANFDFEPEAPLDTILSSNGFLFQSACHNYRGSSARNPSPHDESATPTLSYELSSSNSTFAPSVLEQSGSTDFSGFLVPELCTFASRLAHPSPNELVSSSSTDNEATEKNAPLTGLVSWANRVTQLNVKFTQHLQSTLRIESVHLDLDDAQAVVPAPDPSHDPDQTFHLSEAFIDILREMCSRLPPIKSPAGKETVAGFFCSDEASWLLIYSTYVRFLEMHHLVLRYVLARIGQIRQGLSEASCSYLPKLIIGSFSLATTSEIRPLIFVNLLESMMTRAGTLFRHIASFKGVAKQRESSESSIHLPAVLEPGLALQAIQTRERTISNTVDRIKTTLSQLA